MCVYVCMYVCTYVCVCVCAWASNNNNNINNNTLSHQRQSRCISLPFFSPPVLRVHWISWRWAATYYEGLNFLHYEETTYLLVDKLVEVYPKRVGRVEALANDPRVNRCTDWP